MQKACDLFGFYKIPTVSFAPSLHSSGPCRYQGGRLVPTSIDVYLAMEYASGGDLFNLRGQLSEKEVTSIMWQLLCAVSYLHSQNVWHRDLKSANVLLTLENGVRVVKVRLKYIRTLLNIHLLELFQCNLGNRSL